MKKMVLLFLLIILSIVIFTIKSYNHKSIDYIENLGHDFTELDCEEIVFNAYHSNTGNHTWQLLKTFVYEPEQNNFVDIRLEGKENSITIVLENNNFTQINDSLSYRTNDIDSYQLIIDDFEGTIDTFEKFEVKDIQDEQFYSLYPIDNNDGGSYFAVLDLNEPYDEAQENLDNILITIQIK